MGVLGKRIVAGIIDYTIAIILFFVFFSLIIIPIYDNFTKYPSIQDEYAKACDDYLEYRIFYEIDIYDENGDLIENPLVSETNIEKFQSDNNVKELASKIFSYERKLNNYVLLRFASTLVVTYLLTYLLPMLIFKDAQTVGMKVMHIGVSDKFNCKIRLSQKIVRFAVLLSSEAAFICFMLTSLFAIELANLYLAMMFSLVMIINILYIAFNRNHDSLKEYFTATKVIDMNNELIFKSITDKRDFEKQIADIKEKV